MTADERDALRREGFAAALMEQRYTRERAEQFAHTHYPKSEPRYRIERNDPFKPDQPAYQSLAWYQTRPSVHATLSSAVFVPVVFA